MQEASKLRDDAFSEIPRAGGRLETLHSLHSIETTKLLQMLFFSQDSQAIGYHRLVFCHC